MKKAFLLIVIIIPLLSQAQQITSYKAANGITYHINDTVKMGKGSGDNGSFLYFQQKGLLLPPSGPLPGFTKAYTNRSVIIKNIKKTTVNGTDKYQFIVGDNGPFRFAVYIDDAIQACEVIPCQPVTQKQPASVADEIKKLKDLLDSGALTQAEFDAQKKKLLNE